MSIQILPHYDVEKHDDEFQHIITHNADSRELSERIDQISQYFLNRPYLRGALGEGPLALFDQNPLYRHDAFDCVTYVNTVLALALARDLSSFKRMMLRLNYYAEDARYHQRFHFISADWNPSLCQFGLLQDYTAKVTNKKGEAAAVQAQTVIDRPNWLRAHRLEQIKLLQSLSSIEALQRLSALHKLADCLKKERVKIFYLPLAHLFDVKGQPNQFLFEQIPHASIIEIVCPNCDLREKIGTHLHVSHLGFGFRVNKQFVFRHASQSTGKVSDQLLIEYLKKYRDHPTVKGINIQRLIER